MSRKMSVSGGGFNARRSAIWVAGETLMAVAEGWLVGSGTGAGARSSRSAGGGFLLLSCSVTVTIIRQMRALMEANSVFQLKEATISSRGSTPSENTCTQFRISAPGGKCGMLCPVEQCHPSW